MRGGRGEKRSRKKKKEENERRKGSGKDQDCSSNCLVRSGRTLEFNIIKSSGQGPDFV